jgi:hypothetical protein
MSARAPALAAVSPNRDSGAWIRAGPRPLHKKKHNRCIKAVPREMRANQVS